MGFDSLNYGFGATGSGGGGGTGTVTSVAMTLPSTVFVNPPTGSPITTSGTIAVAFTTQTANTVFAGPATGAAAVPTFRALVAADIPDLSATYWKINGNTTGNDTSWIGTVDNHDWLVKTNNTTRLTVLKSGEIGIGASPVTNTKLYIQGTGGTSSTFGFQVANSGPTVNFYVRDDGAVSSTLGYWIGSDKFLSEGTGGANNIFGGIGAGTNSGVSAINNVVWGTNAFNTNVTGTNSIAIGYHALQTSNSPAGDSHNVGIGANAMMNLTTGFQNVSVGSNTLAALTTHFNNTALGYFAGNTCTGGQNVFLGTVADCESGTPVVNKSIAIGSLAKVNADNQLSIGSGNNGIIEVWIGSGFGLTGPPVINYYTTNVGTGNTNTASNANIIWNASRGTGTGTGADFIWKVAPAGASGSSQNTLIEAFRINQRGAVSINNATPAASSILDIVSTTLGVLLPRMTKIQRTAITPAEGLIVYDTTLHGLFVYDGTNWLGL